MVNHFLITLYNMTEPNADGVYNPLKFPLTVPSSIAGYFSRIRGNTPESAWRAAKHGVKVVSASTWTTYLRIADSRMTTDYDILPGENVGGREFIDSINSAKGDVLHAITQETPLVKKGLERDVLPMERAAAILVGVVRLIDSVNFPQE